ncbi:hypothetical protein BDW74DRAFT_176644 [Aspergillus multicolor]|uniref:uncharacterized protein n=1 Tax=Aspergillus multicolor TaxID=41759 RepID=UPI003CCD9DA2
MCMHCWALIEAGKQSPPKAHLHGFGPSKKACIEMGHMCDYCWSVNETSASASDKSRKEAVVSKDDNCLSVSTMCDNCRRSFHTLKSTTQIQEEDLLATPGTYPVKFWKKVARGAVDQGFAAFIISALAERLGKLFSAPVIVRAFTTTPAGEKVRISPASSWSSRMLWMLTTRC